MLIKISSQNISMFKFSADINKFSNLNVISNFNKKISFILIK